MFSWLRVLHDQSVHALFVPPVEVDHGLVHLLGDRRLVEQGQGLRFPLGDLSGEQGVLAVIFSQIGALQQRPSRQQRLPDRLELLRFKELGSVLCAVSIFVLRPKLETVTMLGYTMHHVVLRGGHGRYREASANRDVESDLDLDGALVAPGNLDNSLAQEYVLVGQLTLALEGLDGASPLARLCVSEPRRESRR